MYPLLIKLIKDDQNGFKNIADNCQVDFECY